MSDLADQPTYTVTDWCDGTQSGIWHWTEDTDRDAIDLAYELSRTNAKVRHVRSLESGDFFVVESVQRKPGS